MRLSTHITLCCVVSFCLVHKARSTELFGYQLHSYNDLRQWESVSQKSKISPGITRIKIDPHYVNHRAFCQRHGFSTNECLVLSHDAPDMNHNYNTTLQLPNVFPLVQNGEIALCGKYVGMACSNSAFMSVADKMFELLTPAAREYNITLILDGSLKPSGLNQCIQKRWEPWGATYIPGQDPSGAATSDDGYFSRFNVLNMRCCENSVKSAASWNPPFGKFSKKDTPFQLWEPSDEATIRRVRDTYQKTGSKKEFLFAINQDPVSLLNYIYSDAKNEKISAHSIVSSTGDIMAEDNNTLGIKLSRFEICGDHIIGLNALNQSIHVFTRSNVLKYSKMLFGKIVSLQCDQKHHYITAASTGEIIRHSITNQDKQTVLNRINAPVESSFTLTSVNITVFSNGSYVYAKSGSKDILMGIGKALRVSKPDGDGSEHVLFTMSDAYCFNCERYNKRPQPLVCDQKPKRQPNIMAYTYVTPNALRSLINSSKERYGGGYILHSCNSVALHGSFGSGENPVPIVTSNQQKKTFQIYYKPLRTVNSNTCPSECGCPEPNSSGNMQIFSFPAH